jgi:hypothetical protein
MMRYKLTWLQRMILGFVSSALGLGIANAIILASGSAPSASEMIGCLVFVLAATLTCLMAWPGYGITLTPEAAVIHDGRTRVMDWRGVAGISAEKEFGYRIVVIRGLDGRRVKLRAPVSLFDRKFDEKVKAIRACWHERHT